MGSLDSLIHPVNRLRIMALLNVSEANQQGVHREMKFQTLRDTLQLSDATLSKQLGYLEEAGYVKRNREYGLSRDKDVVWVQLTQRGQKAFDEHITALKEIAGEI